MTIEAKIIADSINVNGDRITTFELIYPRFTHSELMTHRLFSRNAASSRAIPVQKSIEFIQEDTAMPIHWGKNQPGMSAREECNNVVIDKQLHHYHTIHIETVDGKTKQREPISEEKTVEVCYTRENMWRKARDEAIKIASQFNAAGYHKQIVNRILEPYSHIKVVLTSTNYENWFWLRNHKDAQPEIAELARRMHEQYNASTPRILDASSWHVPYYGGTLGAWIPSSRDNSVDENGHSLADALAISASCCAQVSYRKLDDSLEKARDIYNRLIVSMPPHFSPFEHQAKPHTFGKGFDDPGITHMDKSLRYWSGNFMGWVQNRQLIMEQLNIEPMTSKPQEKE